MGVLMGAFDHVLDLEVEISPEVYGDRGSALAVQLAEGKSTITVAEAIAVAIVNKALCGDKGALELIMRAIRFDPPMEEDRGQPG